MALNDVMTDMQKASVSMQMGIQVRNKLVAAYQEVIEAAHENAKAFHDKCENKDLRVCGRG